MLCRELLVRMDNNTARGAWLRTASEMRGVVKENGRVMEILRSTPWSIRYEANGCRGRKQRQSISACGFTREGMDLGK